MSKLIIKGEKFDVEGAPFLKYNIQFTISKLTQYSESLLYTITR